MHSPDLPYRSNASKRPGCGKAPDILARLIGPQVSEVFGQPIVVDNRPGGAGTVGATLAVRAAPDGYTLILVSGSFGVSAALHKTSYAVMTAIVSGEVQSSISSLVPAVPHAKAGRLRAIAVTTPKRPRALPDVPTIAETVPGYDRVKSDGPFADGHVS